ncbi:MAG: YhjD/YihY/BrkB family envelope integrity protein [Candidatus Omnitrophota bacterium]
MIPKLINFLKTDIWRIKLKNLPFRKSFLIKQLRVVLVAIRGFDEDKCQLRASALTFYSLLSIVPVAAMAFGIAKGFGFEKMLEKQLLSKFTGQEEILTQVVSFSNRLLENTRGGMVAGIGVAILFWTVIKVLGNIEKSFNDIWGIKDQRSMGRRFSDYLSIMLLCPILFIMASSVTVFITAQITLITQKISLLGAISPLIFLVLKFLPYCVIWFMFTFIYIFMPNTKVSFKSGLLGGIIAGTIYQIAQWGYIGFQIGMAKYNAIYGSFAALPLFLMWLQISWLIVLLGAEISFASQNIETYEFEPDCLGVSYSFKKLLSLRITHLLTQNFTKGEKPITATEISHILEIPIKLVRQILYELVNAGILSESHTSNYKQVAFQPGRDVSELTLQRVIDIIEDHGTSDLEVGKSKELDKISSSLKGFSEVIAKSQLDIPLKSI